MEYFFLYPGIKEPVLQQTNIKEEIGKLIGLQTLDSQLYALKKEKDDKPKLLDELTQAFEAKKQILKEFEERSKALLLKRKEKEGELKAKEDSIQQLKGKQFSLKTNKEMGAMLTEIKGHEMDKSLLEEAILKIFDEQDILKQELEKKQAELKQEEDKFSREKQIIQNRITEINGQIQDLETKRAVAEKEVDSKIATQYNRILNGKNGLALVAVKDNACQGCHINVTHQVLNEIKMSDRIIFCTMCARMLYIPEDFE